MRRCIFRERVRGGGAVFRFSGFGSAPFQFL